MEVSATRHQQKNKTASEDSGSDRMSVQKKLVRKWMEDVTIVLSLLKPNEHSLTLSRQAMQYSR